MCAETEIQREIMERLRRKPGIYAWRNNSGATKTKRGQFLRYGHVGSGDIIGVAAPDGRFFSIEVKTTKGVVSEEQENFILTMHGLGAIAFVAHSADEAMTTLEAWLADT
jgi:hypothetical protein